MRRETIELTRAYYSIPESVRHPLLQLVKSAAQAD